MRRVFFPVLAAPAEVVGTA